MHSLEEIRILNFTPELINEIVLDVEKYPEFLPWCSRAKVISQDNETIIAELVINFKGFSEKYTSKIIHKKRNGGFIIEVEAISGPFQYLKNIWDIKSKKNSSEVKFSIDFKLKSKILDLAVGMFFSLAVQKMITAFEQRAKAIAE